VAAFAAWYCTADHPNIIPRNAPETFCAGSSASSRRRVLLLTFGYTAHCWELLGMWAWMPTFLAAAFSSSLIFSGPIQGLWIGISLHMSGCVAAFIMGSASDRFGRRRVLITLALLGAACSFSIGWLNTQPALLILAIATIYGFAAVGDSPVLSTAMTESVPKGSLGSALALRSILGFGAGGAAPFVLGFVRDSSLASIGWGISFAILGIGGALAALSALLLPSDGKARAE
jgi:MFS family permease